MPQKAETGSRPPTYLGTMWGRPGVYWSPFLDTRVAMVRLISSQLSSNPSTPLPGINHRPTGRRQSSSTLAPASADSFSPLVLVQAFDPRQAHKTHPYWGIFRDLKGYLSSRGIVIYPPAEGGFQDPVGQCRPRGSRGSVPCERGVPPPTQYGSKESGLIAHN